MCRIFSYRLPLYCYLFGTRYTVRGTRKNNGFTLLELIITVALISVMLGALSMLYSSGLSVFSSQETRSSIKYDAGRFLITMAAELRLADALTIANQTLIVFSVDSDANGVNEAIQYAWPGVQAQVLNRTLTSTVPAYTITTPAVNAVNNISFSYYGANNSLLSFPVDAAQVKLVSVNLMVSDNDETFLLRSQARLRNL